MDRSGIGIAGAALALLLAAAGCGGDAAPAWKETPLEALGSARQAKKQTAIEARDRAAQLLVRRLGEALEAGGPGAAIRVCRDLAPKITAEVAAERGVRLGRTSFQLRNPDNQPPAWAKPFIEERRREPVWLEGPDGALAGLLPIQTMMPCLTCHGPAEDLPEEVKGALAEHYPKDEATGFRLGDLRGWFWVEVP